jgi:hypothetical protein
MGSIESLSLDDSACTTRIGTGVPTGTVADDEVSAANGAGVGVVTLLIGEPQPVVAALRRMTAVETAMTRYTKLV